MIDKRRVVGVISPLQPVAASLSDFGFITPAQSVAVSTSYDPCPFSSGSGSDKP